MSCTHIFLIPPVVLLNADLSKRSAGTQWAVPVNTFAVALPTTFLSLPALCFLC